MKNNHNSYPILYTFRRCPYAIRARMVLAYTGTKVEIREISLRNRPAELYSISPKGTVPVLYFNDETVIDESVDIIIWALSQSDPDSWLSKDRSAQLEIVHENDGDFKYWLDRYKYFDRYPKKSREDYRSKCDELLDKLDIMASNSLYLFRNKISMVDIAIFPFIRQIANVDQAWFEDAHSNLFQWLNRIIESPLFMCVMDKYDEYKVDQEPLITNFIN